MLTRSKTCSIKIYTKTYVLATNLRVWDTFAMPTKMITTMSTFWVSAHDLTQLLFRQHCEIVYCCVKWQQRRMLHVQWTHIHLIWMLKHVYRSVYMKPFSRKIYTPTCRHRTPERKQLNCKHMYISYDYNCDKAHHHHHHRHLTRIFLLINQLIK